MLLYVAATQGGSHFLAVVKVVTFLAYYLIVLVSLPGHKHYIARGCPRNSGCNCRVTVGDSICTLQCFSIEACFHFGYNFHGILAARIVAGEYESCTARGCLGGHYGSLAPVAISATAYYCRY